RDHAPATRARGPPSVTRIPVEGRARVAWARFPALRSPGIVCGDGRNARRTGGVRPGTPGSGTRGPVRPVREPGEGPELRAGRAPARRARPRAVRGLSGARSDAAPPRAARVEVRLGPARPARAPDRGGRVRLPGLARGRAPGRDHRPRAAHPRPAPVRGRDQPDVARLLPESAPRQLARRRAVALPRAQHALL